MAITIVITGALIFLQALFYLTCPKLFIWWTRSSLTLASDGLLGGSIFVVLETERYHMYMLFDDHVFLCEVTVTDFLNLFDHISINFRASLAIHIEELTSRVLLSDEVRV